MKCGEEANNDGEEKENSVEPATEPYVGGRGEHAMRKR